MELFFRSKVENRLFCRSFTRFMRAMKDELFMQTDWWLTWFHAGMVLLIVLVVCSLVMSVMVEAHRHKLNKMYNKAA